MKTILNIIKLAGLVGAMAAAGVQPVRAAFSCLVSPSVVSNTYSGYVTLLVTGLTNGETVVVQKFLDANRNGVIDAGEPLWQQFSLSDGTNFHIGGVTNLNVPGDLDATPGQITAKLNFQGDSAQQFAGNYLFKVSDPSGFTVTNSLVVTSFPWPQQFTGTVLSNGVPVPGAGVILFQVTDGTDLNSVGGAVANGSGVYSLPAPTGTYALAAFASNSVANVAAAYGLVLGAGATMSTNLSLIPATTTISGAIQIASNPTQGLPGLLVPMQTPSGLLAVSRSSGASGGFTAAVTANSWKVETDSAGLATLGYVGPAGKTTVSTTNGPVSGLPIDVTLGTALFYGTVKDGFGNPLPGAVDMEANDNFNTYESDGYTDGNGNFVIAALGGLGTNDLWHVQVGNGSGYPNYIFSQPDFDEFGGTNLIAGTAVPASIEAEVATNTISGHVQRSTGSTIAGVGVSLYATINGFNFNNYADTDTNGNFVFAVGAGNWNLSLNSQYGSDSLNTILGAGTFQFPPSTNITITSSNATANFTVETCEGVQIFTTNLPGAQVGYYYNQQLSGSTCSGVQNWLENDPADFPPNLSLNDFGDLQGTPTSSGTYHFSVQLNDGNGNFKNQNLTLVVAGSNSPLQVTTTSLPDAAEGGFYSDALAYSGGQPPVHWSLSPGSAALPPNVTLSTNGLLAGVPATNGTFYFFVRVTDSTNATADQELSLTINPPAMNLQITTTSLTNATQNAFYSASLMAAGGQPPYVWSLAAGSASPPAGLSLSTNGVLSGTPIGSGTAEFIAEVTDATNAWTYQVLSLTVNASGLPQAIKLTVPAGPAGGALQFSFKIAADTLYTIQTSTNLTTWTDYETFDFTNSSPTSGESWMVTVPNPGTGRSFYRVKVGP